jgi:hypothetical protein
MKRSDATMLGLSALNAIVSTSALFMHAHYASVFPVAVFSMLVFVALCWEERENILFLARTFILGFLGYFPMLVKIVFGEHGHFNVYEPISQGFDIVILMYVTTSYALLSNCVGLMLGRRGFEAAPAGPPRADLSATYWQAGFYLSVPLAVLAAYIYIKGYGASVLTAGYASEEQGAGVSGATNTVGAMALFMIAVAGLKGHVRYWKWIFIPVLLLYVVYSQILMGARQDAMSLLFGLVVLYGVVRGRSIPVRMRYVPLIVVLYVFFEVWGIARGALALDDWSVIELMIDAASSVNQQEGIAFGTVSAISAPFANTVWLVETGGVKPLWGLSYLEYLLRIPPEAVFPDRPQDYAYLSAEHGLISMGGFFELGEVYLNFGVIGGLLVPGVVSFCLARSYCYAISRQSMFAYFMLFTFLAIFLRGTWYQTFAFFRSFTVALSLYAAFFIVRQLIVSRRPALPPAGQPI